MSAVRISNGSFAVRQACRKSLIAGQTVVLVAHCSSHHYRLGLWANGLLAELCPVSSAHQVEFAPLLLFYWIAAHQLSAAKCATRSRTFAICVKSVCPTCFTLLFFIVLSANFLCPLLLRDSPNCKRTRLVACQRLAGSSGEAKVHAVWSRMSVEVSSCRFSTQRSC